MTKKKIEKPVKPKQALKAGLFFGIPMVVFFSLSLGVTRGIIAGLVSGILFGLITYLFVNSKIVRKQTEIGEEILLPGEEIIAIKAANLVVKPKEFGLNKFAFDDLLWTVGMKNKEALGGKLHVTNFRLIFKSHKLNRLRGVISIFLPTIDEIKNSSYFITKKITISTSASKVDFVIDDVDNFINTIELQKMNLNSSSIKNIQELVIEYPEKCSDGLKSWNSLNTLNNIFLIGRKTEDGLKLVINPLGALGAIFMKEFLDKTISEQWQKKFNK